MFVGNRKDSFVDMAGARSGTADGSDCVKARELPIRAAGELVEANVQAVPFRVIGVYGVGFVLVALASAVNVLPLRKRMAAVALLLVVLGLVTTKTGRRQTVEELSRRIEEASAYFPLDQLALSPQCGFATSILGNALSPEDQRAKLETIAKTAEAVWS